MIKPRGAIGGNEVYGWDFVGKTTGMIIDPISGTAGEGTSLGRRFIPGHTETPVIRTLVKNKFPGGGAHTSINRVFIGTSVGIQPRPGQQVLMSGDVPGFLASDWQGLLEKMMKRIEQDVMDRVLYATQTALKVVFETSPMNTGYYKYNHRAALNNTDVGLDPSQKPDKKIPVPSSSELIAREMGAIEGAELGEEIVLGTAVPYSDFVEGGGKNTRSHNVYSLAALAATVVLREMFE